MPKSFKLPFTLNVKDPRFAMRAVLGVLLVANIAAAIVAFKPFGGSAEDLAQEQHSLQAQVMRGQQQLAMTKELVGKVDQARTQGNDFLAKYFTGPDTTAVMLLTELESASKQAGIKMGQATFTVEPIEGSDTMAMRSTNVGFEGNYVNLTKFVNLLDKSPRFMIIESLQAAAPPQQGGQALNVTLKIDTFERETATP